MVFKLGVSSRIRRKIGKEGTQEQIQALMDVLINKRMALYDEKGRDAAKKDYMKI